MKIRLNGLDERLVERIAAIEAGDVAPAVPRDAATVMVVREAAAAGGIEVLMLRRTAAMKFAPGAYVFPGGAVDRGDFPGFFGGERARTTNAWFGPDAGWFGERLGATPELASALVYAAIRETFEEAGVLFADTKDGQVAVPDGPSWEAGRAELTTGSLTLAGLLDRHGLMPRADLLTPWARWITPEAEPRRFDTRFFAAALPAGQQVTGHDAESDRVAWLRPADALDAARRGEITLLPPTASTLAELAAASGVGDVLVTERAVVPIQPRLAAEAGEAWLHLPDEVSYPL